MPTTARDDEGDDHDDEDYEVTKIISIVVPAACAICLVLIVFVTCKLCRKYKCCQSEGLVQKISAFCAKCASSEHKPQTSFDSDDRAYANLIKFPGPSLQSSQSSIAIERHSSVKSRPALDAGTPRKSTSSSRSNLSRQGSSQSFSNRLGAVGRQNSLRSVLQHESPEVHRISRSDSNGRLSGGRISRANSTGLHSPGGISRRNTTGRQNSGRISRSDSIGFQNPGGISRKTSGGISRQNSDRISRSNSQQSVSSVHSLFYSGNQF